MINLNFLEQKTFEPAKVVKPQVQLIGWTHFEPPFDVDSGDRGKLQLDPHEFATPAENIIEFAGRNCYRSWDRPREATATIGGYITNILEQNHISVLRHAQATFYITGVSRRFSHEIITHGHLTRSQESQRYVPADVINVVLPPVVWDWEGIRDETGEYRRNEFSDMVRLARNSYKMMVDIFHRAGIKGKKAREAAAYLLPGGVETRLVITGNLQAWLEVLTKRDTEFADKEMQIVMDMIWSYLINLAPNVFRPESRMIWDQGYRERQQPISKSVETSKRQN